MNMSLGEMVFIPVQGGRMIHLVFFVGSQGPFLGYAGESHLKEMSESECSAEGKECTMDPPRACEEAQFIGRNESINISVQLKQRVHRTGKRWRGERTEKRLNGPDDKGTCKGFDVILNMVGAFEGTVVVCQSLKSCLILCDPIDCSYKMKKKERESERVKLGHTAVSTVRSQHHIWQPSTFNIKH